VALRESNEQEVGGRIRWVRREANKTTRALAKDIGEKSENILTLLEQGRSHRPERIIRIAKACAGEGNLVANEELIWRFLVGQHEDPRDLLREKLRLVAANTNGASGTRTKVYDYLEVA